MDNIQEAAVQVINNLVERDDIKLQREDEYKTSLKVRQDSVAGQLETQRQQIKLVEQDKYHKLKYVQESLSRALWRSEEAVKLVESVSAQVAEIVAPTARLSVAQRNLTKVITLMERFRSFVTNLERMEELYEAKDYETMARTLLATQQFADHFSSFSEAEIVKKHLDAFERIQSKISSQITVLFAESVPRTGAVKSEKAILLGHAAIVIDVLGRAARQNLIRWFSDWHLDDYKSIFKSHEYSNLESITNRFSWLRRNLVTFTGDYSIIFPAEWKVEEAFCIDFCTLTARDLSNILLQNANGKVDLTQLQKAVQHVRTFEQHLLQKLPPNPALQAMSQSFEPFLSHFVHAHDEDLVKFHTRLPTKLTIGDFDNQNVLFSAPELIQVFYDMMNDIAELTHGRPLVELAAVLCRHLGSYSKYLNERIPKMGKKPLGTFEMRTLCAIINTADCLNIATSDMADQFRRRVHPYLGEEIIFDSAQQDFLVQISIAIGRQHLSVTTTIEPSWIAMNDVNWTTLKSVGDYSSYVGKIQKVLYDVMTNMRTYTRNKSHYLTLVNRLIHSIVQRFSESIQKIRPLGEIAAEQLRVDLEALRSSLFDLGRSQNRSSFATFLASEVAPIENMLKCIQVPAQPVSIFVQNYLLVMADNDELRFIGMLDIKGIKKSDRQEYLLEFSKHIPERPSTLITRPTKQFQFFKFT
jgi:hypothetical protein